MIGLQPLLTEMVVLEEKEDTDGVILRPFETVETFRWTGIPIFRNRILSVIHLTKPIELLESFVVRQANLAQRALLSNLKVRLDYK